MNLLVCHFLFLEGSDSGILSKSVSSAGSSNQKKKNIDESKLSSPSNERRPFQRVRPEDVTFVDNRLKDNTYESKGGSDVHSYGFKAHQDLIVVRGKNFRTEKNKKKKGAYKGGAIDMNSHSIKFPDSD